MQTAEPVGLSSIDARHPSSLDPDRVAANRVAIHTCHEQKTTAAVLLDALEQFFHSRVSEWIFLRELRAGTGSRNNSAQRIDAFALNCLAHLAMKRVAYEVKISRADFFCELRHPVKRRLAMRYSNEFYFVTPPGLVEVCEVPVDCGLIEVSRETCVVIVPAPWRDTPGPSWQLLAAMLRHQRRQLMSSSAPQPKQQRFAFE